MSNSNGTPERTSGSSAIARELLHYMVEMGGVEARLGDYLTPDGVVIENRSSTSVVNSFRVPEELANQVGVKSIDTKYRSVASNWLDVLRQNPGCAVAQIDMRKVEKEAAIEKSAQLADTYFIETASKRGGLILTGSSKEKSDSKFGHILRWAGRISARRRRHDELRYRTSTEEAKRVAGFFKSIVEMRLSSEPPLDF